ncbi:MAG: UDP-N-acetylmuramate--L-alanine ligase [Planctomycetota bacterium]|nr:UDP-N-acetylmuramate--L-alanine ligase [Planctomycetota bacterium]
MFRKARNLHFVGIGGSGMCGIAEVLANLGYTVSGSDLAATDVTRRLKRHGVSVRKGHQRKHVNGADVVVVSSAVHEDNPEVVEARRLKIPVIPRAEMLAELMRMKTGVAVAGAHGKTTTTGLVAEVLAGLDPTVVIGGRFGTLGANAKLGKGDLMVAEADESDGSFLKMKPTIAVVTNIDREHLDHYRDLGEIQDAFVTFLSRVPFYGAAVVCIDDPNVRAILPRVDRKVIAYGLSSEADVQARELEFRGFQSRFEVWVDGVKLGRITLPQPGRHLVYNSLAAIAVGLELDLPFRKIRSALAAFGGIDRRFQRLGEAFGATVIDDYGHHPTEIEATLSAARESFGTRTHVVFQPHRYSRTSALLEEFGRAFYFADDVLVTEIYPAGESPLPGIDGEAVASALRRHGHPSVMFVPTLRAVPGALRSRLEPGDLVLTLGAGDVHKVGHALIRASERAARPGSARRAARSK